MPTLWLLIAARASQGLGAAIMMALSVAFVSEIGRKAKTESRDGLLRGGCVRRLVPLAGGFVVDDEIFR